MDKIGDLLKVHKNFKLIDLKIRVLVPNKGINIFKMSKYIIDKQI